MESDSFRPIIYVRGYAMTQPEVDAAVDDPFYGFNLGSTHFRVNQHGGSSFFAFESPLLRLTADYDYRDAFSGTRQTAAGITEPKRTVWIFRYYDATSRTFDDRPGGHRLTIEEAASGLYRFIREVQGETGCAKVHLVAHSMGGLVCRCLMEKLLPEEKQTSTDLIDKFVTFGTPHGGIEFAVGNGVLERTRDWLGIKDQDNFGRKRLYEFLTPGKTKKVPKEFDPHEMRPEAFPADRVLCIVGTNARDYEVAYGLSRWSVGPQSDGLVQIANAWVHGSHRAYIHRSHSGRYGMVNSEEGYQNLRRFLFGDVKTEVSLCDFTLVFPRAFGGFEKAYHFEVQIAIQSLPMLLHERTLAHFCPVTIDERTYQEAGGKGLSLFTNFLLDGKVPGNKEIFSIYLAVHEQNYENGHPVMAGHLEQLPLWSDYLIVEIERQANDAALTYAPRYSWASESRVPAKPLEMTLSMQNTRADGSVLLPARASGALGPKARLQLATFDWS